MKSRVFLLLFLLPAVLAAGEKVLFDLNWDNNLPGKQCLSTFGKKEYLPRVSNMYSVSGEHSLLFDLMQYPPRGNGGAGVSSIAFVSCKIPPEAKNARISICFRLISGSFSFEPKPALMIHISGDRIRQIKGDFQKWEKPVWSGPTKNMWLKAEYIQPLNRPEKILKTHLTISRLDPKTKQWNEIASGDYDTLPVNSAFWNFQFVCGGQSKCYVDDLKVTLLPP